DLLFDRFGQLDDATERIVASCAGNPILLEMSPPRGREPGSPDSGGSADEGSRRLLLARLFAPCPTAQRDLPAASGPGARFRSPIAAVISDLRPDEAASTIETLFASGLFMADDGGRVRFRHELIRQAVYDDISPPARAYLHERALRALRAAGAPIGEA